MKFIYVFIPTGAAHIEINKAMNQKDCTISKPGKKLLTVCNIDEEEKSCKQLQVTGQQAGSSVRVDHHREIHRGEEYLAICARGASIEGFVAGSGGRLERELFCADLRVEPPQRCFAVDHYVFSTVADTCAGIFGSKKVVPFCGQIGGRESIIIKLSKLY